MIYFASIGRLVMPSKQDKEVRQEQVEDLYNKIADLLAEVDIKWADLARLIGLSPKTLSSMRSQKVNPSFTTIRRIAEALDISMDELLYDHCKAPHLYEFYWAVPRAIRDIELQDMTCNQCLTIAYVTGHKNMTEFRHRVDIRRDEIHEKLAELKKKEEGNK
jgi:DNA-binding XRE family transcriptional regulator